MRRLACTHGDYTAGLHEHVVQRSRDRAGSNAVGIGRCPSHLYGVHVWSTSDQGDHGEIDPRRGILCKGVQGDDEGERPKLVDNEERDTTVDDFSEITEYEKHQGAKDRRRDSQKVSFRSRVSETAQRKSQIIRRRTRRNCGQCQSLGSEQDIWTVG